MNIIENHKIQMKIANAQILHGLKLIWEINGMIIQKRVAVAKETSQAIFESRRFNIQMCRESNAVNAVLKALIKKGIAIDKQSIKFSQRFKGWQISTQYYKGCCYVGSYATEQQAREAFEERHKEPLKCFRDMKDKQFAHHSANLEDEASILNYRGAH